MKKLGLLIMPLISASLLVNCGNKTQIYHITIGDHEHLSFTTTDGKSLDNVKVENNKDFTFKMKIDEQINDSGFKLPTLLSIYIGNSTVPLENGYVITETTQYLEANVKIDKSKITNNIKISGNAVPVNYYKIDIDTYGVNHNIDVKRPFALIETDQQIVFTQIGTYALPTKENIYLEIDNSGNWFTPIDDITETYCSYDDTMHTLTIKANKVKSNIAIKVRSSTYQLLNDLSWQYISDYSNAGWAPYMFYIGDEKAVNLIEGKTQQSFAHTVRIIGFNHDYSELPDKGDPDPSKVLGITFEFADLITKGTTYIGDECTTFWDSSGNNYDYRKSNLNNILNNDTKGVDSVINRLPDDLEEVIKPVDKKVGVNATETQGAKNYTSTSFDGKEYPYPKLFPLAYNEMADDTTDITPNEGTKYQYYIDHPNQGDRIKKKVGDSSGKYYWIRSPRINRNVPAWSISINGKFDSYTVNKWEYAVAPAFCI